MDGLHTTSVNWTYFEREIVAFGFEMAEAVQQESPSQLWPSWTWQYPRVS